MDAAVCALTLGDTFSLNGSSTTIGKSCFLASNASASNGINISGGAQVRVAGLTTSGICNGCSSGNVWSDNTQTVRPLVSANRAVPVTDPYAAAQEMDAQPARVSHHPHQLQR